VFNGIGTIKQQAAYIQDDIKAGGATFKLGVRLDHYDGLSTATLAQPRLGVSYAVPGSGTVLRASYGRTLETPYNENLLLSSSQGAAGLVGSAEPLQPGRRHEMEVGIQQGFGRWVVVDFGYFNKHTNNAYDFGVLFDTPIVFRFRDHSKLDGFTGRVNQSSTADSARLRCSPRECNLSPPAAGGVLLDEPTGAFRIDHDQKFQQTTNLQYQ
jgi:hypothetical protein